MVIGSRFTSLRPLRFMTTINRQSRSLTSGASAPMEHLLEEETLPWYKSDQFYPVRIGQVFESKYKVLGKLGYGAHSTVWLCRDLSQKAFVSVKVCTRDAKESTSVNRKLQAYKHLASLKSQHLGQSFIRGLIDTFEISGSSGQHLCLVHPPMHMTIRELQYKNETHRLTEQLLQWTLRNVLMALSFLHDEVNVVHTDISPLNIVLSISDQSILEDFAKDEASNSSPCKVIDDHRIIYASRKLGLPRDALWDQPVLCDFGEARIGTSHMGIIQPELYRAPEVLFEMGWGAGADIWNIAVLVWDLLVNQHLFDAADGNGESSATYHVAEMIGYMGMPSLEYIQRSDVTMRVFDEQGRWKGARGVAIPQNTLEDALPALELKDREKFLTFIRGMLQWEPEKRKTAGELLKDPWISP